METTAIDTSYFRFENANFIKLIRTTKYLINVKTKKKNCDSKKGEKQLENTFN